jgi:energy-coupling factor transporter ATP-binding protein EcfA2
MTPDDILYSPISNDLADELKKLVKKVMKNPSDKRLLDSVAADIVDLCRRHGITQEDQMVDRVFDAIADLEGKVLDDIVSCQGPRWLWFCWRPYGRPITPPK